MKTIFAFLVLMVLTMGVHAQGKAKAAQPKDDWKTLTQQQLAEECGARLLLSVHMVHAHSQDMSEAAIVERIMQLAVDPENAQFRNPAPSRLPQFRRWVQHVAHQVDGMPYNRGVSFMEIHSALGKEMGQSCMRHPEQYVQSFFFDWPKP